MSVNSRSWCTVRMFNIVFVQIRSDQQHTNSAMADDVDGIFMLNDFCILEIFKRLSLYDLANVKEAYGSLAALTDIEFNRKTRKSLHLRLDDMIDVDLLILKRFGSSVDDLTIDYDNLRQTKWSDIFSVIKEHCNEELKSFAVSGSAVGSITKADVLLISDILKNVETVQVGPFFDSDNPKKFIHILCHCENVKSITIFPISGIISHYKTFFKKNKNLVKLEWHGRLSDSYFKSIVANLKNTRLEEFSLMITKNNFNQNLSQLIRLKYLKRLSIDCWHEDIGSFLQKVNSFKCLNVLSLSFARLNEADIATLSKAKTLTVLKLDCILSTDDHFESVLVLCGNKNFEHLILFCQFEGFDTMDRENFLKIIEKRKTSSAQNCLHLTLRHDIYTAILKLIPTQMVEANYGTIKLIDKFDRNYEHYNLK